MTPAPLTEATRAKVLVDGVEIMNATSADIDRSKDVQKTDVIGTPDKRISTGSVSYSGTLTELRHNDFGIRFIHNQIVNNLDFQSNADVAAVDTSIGDGGSQHVLAVGNLTASQDFVALGNRLDFISLLLVRTPTYDDDLTVVIKDDMAATVATLTMPNDALPTTLGYAQYLLALGDRVALTSGDVYTMEVTHSGGAGSVTLYGADVQAFVLLGTGDNVEDTFTLLHDTVFEDTLFVRLDDDYQGQLEGYTFSDGTGGGGEDEIVFTTPPATGVEVYAKYQFDDSDLFAWRLGFGGATNPQYTLRFEHYDEDGKMLDAYQILDVQFSSNGIVVAPATFVEQTLSWEGVREESVP